MDAYEQVTELHELKYGRYLRWKDKTGNMCKGAFLVDLEFSDRFGTRLLLAPSRASKGRFFRVAFDRTFYQKDNEKESIQKELSVLFSK
jgi:hypothetical protein